MYDVGQIARDLQDKFGLFVRPRGEITSSEKNRATPEDLAVLLDELAALTEELAERRRVVQVQTIAEDLWDSDSAAWRARLAEYQAAVRAAPKGDRHAVLWSVTAPLLLGFYGGAGAASPQQPIDAVTPFSLANQLDVADAWREERWQRLWGELEKRFADAAKGAADAVTSGIAWLPWIVGGVVVFGGAVVLMTRNGR